jgi:mRNA export factor
LKDVEVVNPPDDSISCLRFSPMSVTNSTFLIAGSWDNNVRCWEIQSNGQTVPKTQQSMQVSVFVIFVGQKF